MVCGVRECDYCDERVIERAGVELTSSQSVAVSSLSMGECVASTDDARHFKTPARCASELYAVWQAATLLAHSR